MKVWLVYFESKNSGFGFYCKVFANNTKNEYCNWTHLSQTFANHEKSKAQMNGFKYVMHFNKLALKTWTIYAINEKIISLWKKDRGYWPNEL